MGMPVDVKQNKWVEDKVERDAQPECYNPPSQCTYTLGHPNADKQDPFDCGMKKVMQRKIGSLPEQSISLDVF